MFVYKIINVTLSHIIIKIRECLQVGELCGAHNLWSFFTNSFVFNCLQLNVIRNVSHDATLGCFFHIELGRLACIGPGQLSLKTDDNNITQNMHLVILK